MTLTVFVLRRVLVFLPWDEVLIHAWRVSRTWRRECNRAHVWKALFDALVADDPDGEELAELPVLRSTLEVVARADATRTGEPDGDEGVSLDAAHARAWRRRFEAAVEGVLRWRRVDHRAGVCRGAPLGRFTIPVWHRVAPLEATLKAADGADDIQLAVGHAAMRTAAAEAAAALGLGGAGDGGGAAGRRANPRANPADRRRGQAVARTTFLLPAAPDTSRPRVLGGAGAGTTRFGAVKSRTEQLRAPALRTPAVDAGEHRVDRGEEEDEQAGGGEVESKSGDAAAGARSLPPVVPSSSGARERARAREGAAGRGGAGGGPGVAPGARGGAAAPQQAVVHLPCINLFAPDASAGTPSAPAAAVLRGAVEQATGAPAALDAMSDVHLRRAGRGAGAPGAALVRIARASRHISGQSASLAGEAPRIRASMSAPAGGEDDAAGGDWASARAATKRGAVVSPAASGSGTLDADAEMDDAEALLKRLRVHVAGHASDRGGGGGGRTSHAHPKRPRWRTDDAEVAPRQPREPSHRRVGGRPHRGRSQWRSSEDDRGRRPRNACGGDADAEGPAGGAGRGAGARDRGDESEGSHPSDSGSDGEDKEDLTHGALNLAQRMKADAAEAAAAAKSHTHLLSSDERGVHMYVPGTGVRHFALPCAGETQEQCYDALGRPLLRSLWLGDDATLFAYGQTGTGKTYTMFGPGRGELDDTDRSALGVAPRLATDLMERCKRDRTTIAIVYVSFIEVYDEIVYDLLSGGAAVDIPAGFDLDDRAIPERAGAGGGAGVGARAWGAVQDALGLGRRVFGIRGLGVQTVRVHSAREVMALLHEGSRMRAAAATDMNARSSRSHAIFTLKLVQTHMRTGTTLDSCMHLVDLAGSERVRATQQVRWDRMDELVSINKSLLALGRCVSALSDGAPHVPYRESTLTRLLRPSLGGRCRTSMLVTLSGDPKSGDETTASLRFAERTAAVRNVSGPVHGVPAHDLVRTLMGQLDSMRQELRLLVLHDAEARAQHEATERHSEACARAGRAQARFEAHHQRRVAAGSAAGGDSLAAAAKEAEREAAVELRAAVEEQTATGRALALTAGASPRYVRLVVQTTRLDGQLRALRAELGQYGTWGPASPQPPTGAAYDT